MVDLQNKNTKELDFDKITFNYIEFAKELPGLFYMEMIPNIYTKKHCVD